MRNAKSSIEFFIKEHDGFAREINQKANWLYSQLLNIDIGSIHTDDEYKNYFRNHHLGSRLFFSVQSSAAIIYQSVQKSGKPVQEITFIDYGAGLGTLFMLAGLTGFKKTVYNDYLPEWHQPAKALCDALHITIDEYVAGDIDEVIQYAAEKNIRYDIIASRNVIEHIYDIRHFYRLLYSHNNNAVVFSSTTANYHNLAMRWYHYRIHKKADNNYYRNQRIDKIRQFVPGIGNEEMVLLAELTRGKAKDDFIKAVNNFKNGHTVQKDATLRTNTCDCVTGLWIEHLLTKNEHIALAGTPGFTIEFTSGFWDTHYRYALLNLFTRCLNLLISVLGKRNGIYAAPFVNIIASS